MSDLKRMRIVATGALILMAVLYVLAKSLRHHAPVLDFAAAFAEAAMVGALADWFAVVALFRHPMGIPIPHTAILPSNKNRMGRTLAEFLVAHFLTRDAVRHRLECVDMTARAAEWLLSNAREVSERMVAAAPVLLRALNDADVQQVLRTTILATFRAVEVAPLGGMVLKALMAGEKLDEVVAAAIGLAEELVRGNQELIRVQVRKRIPLPDIPGLSFAKDVVGEAVARKVSEALLENLGEVRSRPDHPLRLQLRRKAIQLAEDLQYSEAYRRRGEALKEEVLRHPAIGPYMVEVVRGLQRDVEKDLGSQDSRLRTRVEQAVVGMAHVLIENQGLRVKVNRWLQNVLLDFVEQHGPEASQFIQERVARWDTAQLTATVEESVGWDLQYIRLNGTLVGGSVGLLIYALSRWVW